MIKKITFYISTLFILASCSSLKPLSFTANRQVTSPSSNPDLVKTNGAEKKEIKFIENISVSSNKQLSQTGPSQSEEPVVLKSSQKEAPVEIKIVPLDISTNAVEAASSLQLKYSLLLNTEVENVKSFELYKKIDEWYGTRYCMGGTTNRCIDCSAFMQVLFASVYKFSLPRTAKEQYKLSTKISRTEMKEGDLLFFNTRGGVSHVGFYLQNNKFVHASTNGVMISDIYDSYYLRRFIGVGRVLL